MHGGKYIEATRPSVKIQLKDQSEVYGGNDYTLETAFIFDCPTSDLVITVYDKFAVNMRPNSLARGRDDNNGTIIGHILIPLVQFFSMSGIKKATQQWYELLPPSKSLQTIGHYRASMPLIRTRIEPLGFICVSVGIALNTSIDNVFAMYFQGAEHLAPLSQLGFDLNDGTFAAAEQEVKARRKSVDSDSKNSDSSSFIMSNAPLDGNDSNTSNNLLNNNGPVDLLLTNTTNLKDVVTFLPFNLVDIGLGPVLIICLVYGCACISISAWELPLYTFFMVLLVGMQFAFYY